MKDRKTDFARFSTLLEQAPHGTIHVEIGGRGGDMSRMQSPNDPIFWLHHSFVDKLWNERQNTPGIKFEEFSGVYNGKSVDSNTFMPHWDIPVSLVIYAMKDLCYTYQEYSGRLPKTQSTASTTFITASTATSSLSTSSLSGM